MKRTLYTIALISSAAAFTACEDVIDLDVPEGKTYTVVDAWITDVPGAQEIRITKTVPYTSSQPAPVVSDATVVLQDLTSGTTYPFAFSNGVYRNDPGTAVAIGKLGHAYKLQIKLGTETYEAIDTVRKVPEIDSISYEFKTKENSATNKEGYYARWYGRDLGGQTDYYWIRSYRNDLNNRVADGFAIDAAFNENTTDSAVFISPISEVITNWDKPFQLNEKVIVRLSSCTKESYTFLNQVNNQLQNGGLFAKILENVKSNLKNTNTSSKERVLGWFGTSAVKYKERVMR
ncbi:DUF4249 domain-containing protein [Chitinophaga lutea]